jgi:hypothetical protein
MDDWDAGLFKSLSFSRLSREAKIEFRGEFFNATNTPALGLRDGTCRMQQQGGC